MLEVRFFCLGKFLEFKEFCFDFLCKPEVRLNKQQNNLASLYQYFLGTYLCFLGYKSMGYQGVHLPSNNLAKISIIAAWQNTRAW